MAALETTGFATVSHKPLSKVNIKMTKRSANMSVSAVIWDLECKAMGQACWLHCCCCKLRQDKGHKWECVYDCSMPMRCSRGRVLEKDQAFRGKHLKHNYKLSCQGFLQLEQVSCFSVTEANITNENKKRNTIKLQNTIQSKQAEHKR